VRALKPGVALTVAVLGGALLRLSLGDQLGIAHHLSYDLLGASFDLLMESAHSALLR
jgi:hypothetical protein